MQLELSPAEAEVLRAIVEEYYLGMKEEIYKTEGREYKKELKAKEQLLEGLLHKVSQLATPTRAQ